MSALIDGIALIIEFITSTLSFLLRITNYLPNLFTSVLVYIAVFPTFIKIPIVLCIVVGILKMILTKGGSSN